VAGGRGGGQDREQDVGEVPGVMVDLEAGARHVNIARGLYPREPLPSAALDGLAAYLRRPVTAGQGRTYAGGLTKFEPGEMERLPVPAPALLPAYARPPPGPGSAVRKVCANGGDSGTVNMCHVARS